MGTQGGGPPNKWSYFDAKGLSPDAIVEQLNNLAAQGYSTAAVTFGDYIFVGGYKSNGSNG